MATSEVAERRPWRAAGVERKRLARALEMYVRVEGKPGHYCVFHPTGTDTHWVNLEDNDVPVCDCEDHTYREVLCSHALAAMAYEEDPRLMRILASEIREAWLERRLILQLTDRPLAPRS